MLRLCTDPEHAQFGLGHIPGPPLATKYAAAPVALPSRYARTVNAPVLNQGDLPWCEDETGVTGLQIVTPPVGQNVFDVADLAKLSGTTSDGTTTAAIEQALTTTGGLCDSGPDAGKRVPLTSCQDISDLDTLKRALMAEQFAGLAVAWMEPWFAPLPDGMLPPGNQIAGYHMFDVAEYDDGRSCPDGTLGALLGQNSWGVGWGIPAFDASGGYFWLPYSYLEHPLSAYTMIAVPLPPTYTPRPGMSTLFPTPVRVLDTRPSNPLGPGEDRAIQVAGGHGIPAGAVGVAGMVAMVAPDETGWLAITPTKYVGPSSTLNFVAGDSPRASGFDCGLAPDGTLSVVNGSSGHVHVVLDITRYDLP